MTWGLVAVAGATVVGAAVTSDASRRAANTQADAARQAADMQYQQWRESSALQEPWRQAGITALNQLTPLATNYMSFAEASRPYREQQAVNTYGPNYGKYPIIREQTARGYVNGQLVSEQPIPYSGPSTQTPPSYSDPTMTAMDSSGASIYGQDPGYAFRMAEGMKALERSAAARGGLLSGATLRGIQRYGQDMASQEYTNAFNRYQAERAARLAPLQSLAGLGQTTAQQIGQSGMQMANNVGEMQTSAAAARASGYMGQANSLTGALNTGLNYYQNQQLLNQMTPQQSTGAGVVSGGSGFR